MKYIYIVLIATILIILIVLFSRIKKLMKKVAEANENAVYVNNNLSITKNKINEINKTKQSYQFFINVY
ncbi:MAG: hypothetical protein Q4E99_06725, partial [Bacillota bacterium]|nr:hypothetical protein [Bacillota bacterium]